MPQSNKGWDYATNAQVGVDGEFQIIVACYVTDASNDKEQAIPLAQATMENFRQAGVELPKEENGEVKKIPATLDSGYYSEKAAQGMEEAGFDPYMATGRQKHNQGKAATTTPPELPAEASAKERMQAKVNTTEGKKVYARRKAIVEPVYGQVKGARGFRRFSFRGLLKNVSFRQACMNRPGRFATLAVLVGEDRDACEQGWRFAEGFAAGAQPVSGLASAPQDTRPYSRHALGTGRPTGEEART